MVGLGHTSGAVAGVGARGARLVAKPRQTVAVGLGRGIRQGPLVDSAAGAGRGGGEREGIFWAFLTDIGTVWAKLSSRTSIANVLLVVELVASVAKAILFHGFARAVGVGVGRAEGAVQGRCLVLVFVVATVCAHERLGDVAEGAGGTFKASITDSMKSKPTHAVTLVYAPAKGSVKAVDGERRVPFVVLVGSAAATAARSGRGACRARCSPS